MAFTTCDFIARKGLCAHRCLDGRDQKRCSLHRNRKSLVMCKHCGLKGTTTEHGYCSGIEYGCRYKGQYVTVVALRLRKAQEEEKVEAAALREAENENVEAAESQESETN